MKTYIIPVDDKYYKQPKINPFAYHSQNYNCELDFHKFIQNKELTSDPDEAKWHYLPLYWSYWQLNNNYGRDNREELKKYLDSIVIDYSKTFTISEADHLPDTEFGFKVFSANTPNQGWTTIPELTLPHKLPDVLPEKKHLASFVGSFRTQPIRKVMRDLLSNKEGIHIEQSEHVNSEELFVNTILESYASLCPRGSAMASYRFYESMQLGVCPIMISEVDMRPFKDRIDWNECSYWVQYVNDLPEFISKLDKNDLLEKGKKASELWNRLFNGYWRELVMEELNG